LRDVVWLPAELEHFILILLIYKLVDCNSVVKQSQELVIFIELNFAVQLMLTRD